MTEGGTLSELISYSYEFDVTMQDTFGSKEYRECVQFRQGRKDVRYRRLLQ